MSSKMAPIDRSYTTYYWFGIVTIALYCSVPFSSYYLTLNNIVTLKGSLKVIRNGTIQ